MAENSFICFSESEKQTAIIAQKLAAIAKKGDVFALFGTLGMGKSVFSRAFIQSLTFAEEVPSPTFTLVQTYESKEFEIYHFDLYRIKSPNEIFELGMEEALYQGVCLIEWPEKMKDHLPKDIFRIEILSRSNGREIKIEAFSEEKKERLKKVLR